MTQFVMVHTANVTFTPIFPTGLCRIAPYAVPWAKSLWHKVHGKSSLSNSARGVMSFAKPSVSRGRFFRPRARCNAANIPRRPVKSEGAIKLKIDREKQSDPRLLSGLGAPRDTT